MLVNHVLSVLIPTFLVLLNVLLALVVPLLNVLVPFLMNNAHNNVLLDSMPTKLLLFVDKTCVLLAQLVLIGPPIPLFAHHALLVLSTAELVKPNAPTAPTLPLLAPLNAVLL